MTDPAQPLATQSCIPCRGGVPPLTEAEAELLRRETPEWVLRDCATRIERTFRFKTFAAAFALVGRAAEIAEAERHHPDICFGWGYANIETTTHDRNGITAVDIALAQRIDSL